MVSGWVYTLKTYESEYLPKRSIQFKIACDDKNTMNLTSSGAYKDQYARNSRGTAINRRSCTLRRGIRLGVLVTVIFVILTFRESFYRITYTRDLNTLQSFSSKDNEAVAFSDLVFMNLSKNVPVRLRKDLKQFENNRCTISKIIHQTWKTDKVEKLYANYIKTWLVNNKEWSYSFTTNALNRKFMETKFPEFLDLYDGYKSEIQRADAVRYFLLYEYGGVYADLDFECLRPLDLFLRRKNGTTDVQMDGCVIGQEPFEHAHVLYDKKRLICNAIMMSCPKHPFWLLVFQELLLRREIKTVRATGPKMLSAALDKYEELRRHSCSGTNGNGDCVNLPEVYVPSPYTFYPNFDDLNSNHRKNCKGTKRTKSKRREITCNKLEAMKFRNIPARMKSAFAVHHWAHLWHRPNSNMFGTLYSVDDICNSSDVVVTKAKLGLYGGSGSRRVDLIRL